MKISRVRHVIITSIIFLVIIAIIVAIYSSTISMLKEGTQDVVNRVVAIEDIEPGQTITNSNVRLIQTSKIEEAEKVVYRLEQSDRRTRDTVQETKAVTEFLNRISAQPNNRTAIEKEANDAGISLGVPNDNLWAIGKIAKEKIYKGELLFPEKIVLAENMITDETRLYAIPFESSTTGGYNVKIEEIVDICLLYNDDEKTISEYQSLPDNKTIDIVLAGKQIEDIRDESGNSAKKMAGVVPGYICFNLTYEEINKVELARRQGTLFIGNAENYYKAGTQAETFMPGVTMPNF